MVLLCISYVWSSFPKRKSDHVLIPKCILECNGIRGAKYLLHLLIKALKSCYISWTPKCCLFTQLIQYSLAQHTLTPGWVPLLQKKNLSWFYLQLSVLYLEYQVVDTPLLSIVTFWILRFGSTSSFLGTEETGPLHPGRTCYIWQTSE